MHKKTSSLIGCLEISLWMKGGFNHFNNDLSVFIRSFIFIALNFIFVLLCAPYISDIQSAEMKSITPPGDTAFNTAILYGIKFIVGTAVSIAFMYFFSGIIKRRKHFIRYITVNNWCSLIPLILMTPIYLMWMTNMGNYEQAYPFLLLISLYSYALSAFIIRYVIDIPWELAIFVTVCLFFINDVGFKILHYITA